MDDESDSPLVLLRGGGDLATGVAARLTRCGFHVIVLEIAMPLAVRRLVALAEAVYEGKVLIEDLRGQKVEDAIAALQVVREGGIPVLVDPHAESRKRLQAIVLVDGRMRKEAPELGMEVAPFIVGLGPGFTAGLDCHAVVETNRGHNLGRVYWEGNAEADTAVPERVTHYDADRVLRAPTSGIFEGRISLGSIVHQGDVVAAVDDVPLEAPFEGALRGLLHSGLHVEGGMKVGDLDPRGEISYCYQISDKALSVGGGVLEAILSQSKIRAQLGG